jgi:hypothetical protein
MRDPIADGTMLGGTEIRVTEKCWWSWQMRQSPQPSRLVFGFVPDAGSEKEELATALFAAATFP